METFVIKDNFKTPIRCVLDHKSKYVPCTSFLYDNHILIKFVTGIFMSPFVQSSSGRKL